ncbi:MAG TPA: hypothetical protein VED18_09665 [Candidatus Sulfotelmatobacter sp.]|nr:hypothetical protein [Candidatus Sulfotelmatobacter sp.]
MKVPTSLFVGRCREPGLCLALVLLALLAGCATSDGLTQPETAPVQLQGVGVDIGGTVGPRHGPYPMGR